MSITSILFGAAILGCILLAAYFIRRDRGAHADDAQWPHGKDLKGGGGE